MTLEARSEEVFLGGRSTNRSDLVAVQLPGLALQSRVLTVPHRRVM
ncbi:MAG: hypothetical protein M3P93_06400 [Actinomycetota bacterium]|nr:hypothetical protein [Actinomycetota bacterium]